MKILLTSDPELPVPPKLYGGVERIIDGLAQAYQKQGHWVYLVANPESDCQYAQQIFGWKGRASRGITNIVSNALQLRKIYQQVQPDVIHSFSRLLYTYPLLLSSKVPFLQTYQRAISPNSTALASFVGGKKMNFTCCGKHMVNHLKNTSKWTPVHNFTSTDYFVPMENPSQEHLMFLGRIEDIKGTEEAILTALQTNTKLIIAGNIAPEHQDYFDSKVKPHLENPLINYVGAVNDEQKRFYLQRAKALLFPIKWEEPFGIVIVESTACGTPVIAFDRGAAKEVVIDNKTGFIVNTLQEMMQAVSKLETIDRQMVREDTKNRFSLEIIAQQYLEILNQLIKL